MEKTAGTGKLTAATMTRGTKNYTQIELAQIMEENGIKISPSSKADTFNINILTTRTQTTIRILTATKKTTQTTDNTTTTETWNTTTNKECNLIPKLDAFITNNPAPSNTTGWFLPSAKELLLLCGKEKSNVFANRPLGTSTKTTINNILKSIGATQLGTEADNALYWSTTAAGPKTEYAYYAFEVDFDNGNIARKNKNGSNSLRAVYAY